MFDFCKGMLFVVKGKGLVVLNWTFVKTWIEIYKALRAASRKYAAMAIAVLQP
jgi:hypothetical protein